MDFEGVEEVYERIEIDQREEFEDVLDQVLEIMKMKKYLQKQGFLVINDLIYKAQENDSDDNRVKIEKFT